MQALSSVSDTLYVPLLGRVYASKYHPYILYDETALALYDTLSQSVKDIPGQTEYASLASAVRSMNMDRIIQAFLSANPDSVIVNIGCGLETLFQRNDNGRAVWYELDLPEVIALRANHIPETERDRYLPYSMFDYVWMDRVDHPEYKPVLCVASGLFIYFREEQVIDLVGRLSGFRHAELAFDTLSPAGLKVARRMIGRMDKGDAAVYFCVGDAEAFAAKFSPGAKIIATAKFYGAVDYSRGLAFDTRLRMAISDAFNMVKIIHMELT